MQMAEMHHEFGGFEPAIIRKNPLLNIKYLIINKQIT